MSGPLSAQDLPLEKTIISLDEKSFTFFYETLYYLHSHIQTPNIFYM